jgi:hypothetical protein
LTHKRKINLEQLLLRRPTIAFFAALTSGNTKRSPLFFGRWYSFATSDLALLGGGIGINPDRRPEIFCPFCKGRPGLSHVIDIMC